MRRCTPNDTLRTVLVRCPTAAAKSNWLDLSRHEIRVGIDDQRIADATSFTLSHGDLVDGSVRVVDHGGINVCFRVPQDKLNFKSASEEFEDEIASSAPTDKHEPWQIWLWLKGNSAVRRPRASLLALPARANSAV